MASKDEKNNSDNSRENILTTDTIKLSWFKKIQMRYNVFKENLVYKSNNSKFILYYREYTKDLFDLGIAWGLISLPFFYSNPLTWGLSIASFHFLWNRSLKQDSKEILSSINIVNVANGGRR